MERNRYRARGLFWCVKNEATPWALKLSDFWNMSKFILDILRRLSVGWRTCLFC